MKKRNTEQFDDAKVVELKNSKGENIPVSVEVDDPHEFLHLFFHSPDFKFLYIFSYDENDTAGLPEGKKWTDIFVQAFPNAINVTQKKFDRLYRIKTKAKVIPVAKDTILDRYLP